MDWGALATIASPVIGVFVGIWGNRRFENRPRLISYYTHVSAFQYTPVGAAPIGINTHSVVLRNIGREKATGVRLHHTTLPDFNIWPSVVHTVDVLPNGEKDILIPVLVPGEEITISYLYFQPLLFNQINSGIKSDAGFAKQITVLLQPQLQKVVRYLILAVLLLGVTSALYLSYQGVVYFSR